MTPPDPQLIAAILKTTEQFTGDPTLLPDTLHTCPNPEACPDCRRENYACGICGEREGWWWWGVGDKIDTTRIDAGQCCWECLPEVFAVADVARRPGDFVWAEWCGREEWRLGIKASRGERIWTATTYQRNRSEMRKGETAEAAVRKLMIQFPQCAEWTNEGEVRG